MCFLAFFFFAVHFHNDFLLAVLAKCQALGSTPGRLMAADFNMLKLCICFDLDLVHIAWVKWTFIILLTCESNSYLFERFCSWAIAFGLLQIIKSRMFYFVASHPRTPQKMPPKPQLIKKGKIKKQKKVLKANFEVKWIICSSRKYLYSVPIQGHWKY